jgi:hypothetical protein
MRPRNGVTVGITFTADHLALLRRRFYRCEKTPRFPEFADLRYGQQLQQRRDR